MQTRRSRWDLSPTSFAEGDAGNRFRVDSRKETYMAQALVVDDSKATRMILARALKEFGYVVTEAADGREALRELDQLKEVPDLILTDWNMPVMNGLEFLREVRKAERF